MNILRKTAISKNTAMKIKKNNTYFDFKIYIVINVNIFK